MNKIAALIFTALLFCFVLASRADFIQNYPSTNSVNPGDMLIISATNSSSYGATKSITSYDLGRSILTLPYPQAQTFSSSASFPFNSGLGASTVTPVALATNLSPYFLSYPPYLAGIFTSPAAYTNVPVYTSQLLDLNSLFLFQSSSLNYSITFNNLVYSIAQQLNSYSFNINVSSLRYVDANSGAPILPVWPGSSSFASTQAVNQPNFLTWGDNGIPFYTTYSNLVSGFTNQLGTQLRYVTSLSVATDPNYAFLPITLARTMYGAPAIDANLVTYTTNAGFFNSVQVNTALGSEWFKEEEVVATNMYSGSGTYVKFTQKLYDPTGANKPIYQILQNLRLSVGWLDLVQNYITNVSSIYAANIYSPGLTNLLTATGQGATNYATSVIGQGATNYATSMGQNVTNYINYYFATSAKFLPPANNAAGSTVLASSILHNFNISNIVCTTKTSCGLLAFVYTNSYAFYFSNAPSGNWLNTNYIVHATLSYPIAYTTNIPSYSVIQGTNSVTLFFSGVLSYTNPACVYLDIIP